MLTRDQIVERIRDRVRRPASVRELMQALEIPCGERVAFRRALKRLAADGTLVRVRGHRYGLPDTGDERRRDPGRFEGRVARTPARGTSSVIGRFERDGSGRAHIVPFDVRMLADVAVPDGETRGASPGDMVMAEITAPLAATRGAAGRIVEVFGRAGEPGVDTRVVICRHGLPDAHSPEAIEEARRLAGARDPSRANARPDAVAGRTDFREWTVVTIDGEQARDFDDAISIERRQNGRYRLGVHIADVAAYVGEGTVLDVEARDRGTSVYFPERALHMFPEVLATGLCSLNPRVDRLVQSVVMDVDSDGRVVAAEFHDGVIRCAERMTYTDVNAILTEADCPARRRYTALVPMLEAMQDLYRVLWQRRRQLGSIDFDLDEPEIVLDEAGRVEAILALQRNVAHRIVEEFMLLANQAVAEHLEARGVPALFRVHEAPDPLKVEQFEAFISTLGCSLGTRPESVRPRHFGRVLARLDGKPEQKAVALLMLRTLQKARYAPENLGHFGLAFTHYTHFTSPIRRYPDLVVHRLLREARRGDPPAARREALGEQLAEIARHASARERRAEEAERELVQWTKVRFMADKVGGEFDGFVVAVTAFGLFVGIVEPFVEGLVHVSTLADDQYRYADVAHTLQGLRTGRAWRLGDRVRVRLLRADVWRRQIDFGLVDELDRRRGGRAAGRARGQGVARASRSGRAVPGSRGAKPGRARPVGGARGGRKPKLSTRTAAPPARRGGPRRRR